jgi:DegV family protein with EDD domain
VTTCLIVDAGCDLPDNLIKKHQVKIIPVGIRVGDKTIYDVRDPQQTEAFYVTKALERGEDVDTSVPDEKRIKLILTSVEQEGHEYALGQIITRRRSPTYEVTDKLTNELRGTAKTNFAIQDSKTLFSGQGALAAYTIALQSKGITGAKLRRAVEQMSHNVRAYTVIRDPAYLRERARRKGDKTVSAFAALVGKALNICPIAMFEDGESFMVAKKSGFEKSVDLLCKNFVKQIRKELLSPYIIVSYAGDLNDIQTMPAIVDLAEVAQQNKGRVLFCTMSLAGGVNLGPGSLAIGACTPKFEFDEKL